MHCEYYFFKVFFGLAFSLWGIINLLSISETMLSIYSEKFQGYN